MCQKIVSGTVVPNPDCTGLTDPEIENPDVCVNATCPQGGVLAGFSCQVTVGAPAGFYISDSSGKWDFDINNSPTQALCAAYYNATGDFKIFAAVACCVGGGMHQYRYR